MNKLKKDIVKSYWQGFILASVSAGLVQWLFDMWELSVVVFAFIAAGYLRDSISTYYGLRRHPNHVENKPETDE